MFSPKTTAKVPNHHNSLSFTSGHTKLPPWQSQGCLPRPLPHFLQVLTWSEPLLSLFLSDPQLVEEPRTLRLNRESSTFTALAWSPVLA